MSVQVPVVVGVDVGSSAARAMAIADDGRIQAYVSAPYPPAADLPLGHVYPGTWLSGLVTAIGALGCETVSAICVGGQSPTTVASSGERAITYKLRTDANSPAEQLLVQRAVLEELLGGEIRPRQMWDWLLGRLGASTESQGIFPGTAPNEGYGEPVTTGSICGHTSGEYGIPAGIPLIPGAPDSYLAAWGAGIDVAGRGIDPGGRSGGLGVAVETSAQSQDAVVHFGLPSAVEGTDVVGGPVACHGVVLEWWAGLTGLMVPELLDLAAAVPPGADGVIALPYLEGERAPRWNRDLRGELFGLSVASGPGVVARALIESTAYGLAHIAEGLAVNGIVLTELVCGGGPSRSPLWTKIKAAVLQVPVKVPEHPELAAYGAALGAGAALGWWPAPRAGRPGDWPTPQMTTIQPEPREEYRTGYRRFVELGDAAAARLAREDW